MSELKKGASRASDWKKWKQEGYLLEFPSGVSAYVRPVSLDLLMSSYFVPNELIPHVEEMMRSSSASKEGKNVDTVELSRNNIKFSAAVAYASFISPRVVAEPQEDDEISPEDISTEDLQFLVRWISYPASELRKFSQDQSAGLEPVPPWERLEPEAEPDSAG